MTYSSRRGYDRVKYAKNGEKIRKRVKAYYAKNRERLIAVMRDYRQRNRAKRLVQQREWRLKNLKRVRAYDRERSKQRGVLFPEICAEANRRRRAKVRSATVENCRASYALIYKQTFCHWCSCILHTNNRSVDHVVPISRGGQHAPDNLVAACLPCNASKSDKLYWEWDGELAS